MSTTSTLVDAQQRLLRVAARAIGRAHLAHAYGHCSVRLSPSEFLVCAAKPMGLMGECDIGTVVNVNGALPEGVLGEVRIHQEIYRLHPHIGGVVRSMPPAVMALSAARLTPRCLHGIGTYFSAGVPLWDDPQLVRTPEQAAAVVETLGTASAVVMRGNGAVVAGASLEDAVVLTWYLEDAARMDLALRGAGLSDLAAVIPQADAELRATRVGRIFERMWEYLTADDSEGTAIGSA
jgi:HCOMODA/2-hydroxy-3-carboxy-muconic semialdehyde decarboxylase